MPYTVGAKTHKVVSVCPAGRRLTVQILAYYLLKNRHLIDRHDWWLNTQDPEDIEYLKKLARKYPGFFQVINDDAPYRTDSNCYRICNFFKYTCDETAIYIRFDDDVVWMADDAISSLLKFRVQDHKPLIVYGNLINNTICTHIHQRFGVVPYTGTFAAYGRMDDNCFRMGAEAHEAFFETLKNNNLDRYKFYQWVMHHWENGYSINTICWYGYDMKAINGHVGENEELYLTVDWPRDANRYNSICGTALFSHLWYKPQREWGLPIEKYLQRYIDLIAQEPVYKELVSL